MRKGQYRFPQVIFCGLHKSAHTEILGEKKKQKSILETHHKKLDCMQ